MTGPHASDLCAAVLARLASRESSFGRYQLKGEIARGGMGAILKIWDEDLGRHLAMKVILGQAPLASGSATPPVDAAKLARFLEEAQVTGQLDHPGIVPVHELGLDPAGHAYFTMKLVKGETLKEVFEHVAAGEQGWTQTRALGVLLKVCEAMAYAHDKGVIHRDLKPGNVMVGKFGEVHVMDWGLARILGRQDEKDLRIRPEAPRSTEMRGVREEARGTTPDSPLHTLDGDVVGTPAYMPPEQAAGRIEEMGAHSDVYALGAMLYHLLAGHMPYVPTGARLNNYAIWGLVQQGPPTPIEKLAPHAPAELVAICDKAMARDWKQRYPDMAALAADLSAYLEHRVVAAHETGAWAEAKKWVERNRPLALALAAGVLALVAGLIVSLSLKHESDANAALAEKRRVESDERRTEAEQERDRVLGLADLKRLADLQREADVLWPALPNKAAAFEGWLARATELVGHLPRHREHLAKVEEQLAAAATASARVQALTQRAQGVTVSPITLGTASGIELDWIAEQLRVLISGIESCSSDRGMIANVRSRLVFATSIEERSVTGPDAMQRWTDALAAIAKSEHYGSANWPGGALRRQLGLLPIGADPASGLWEFAHLQSGEAAVRGADGKLILTEEMGLVFVLIPGGRFWMGAQKTDPTGRNYDPQALDNEAPVHEVALTAYFSSKYEMTQGQWERFTGTNPSQFRKANYSSTWNKAGKSGSALHPVEQVSWSNCMDVLGRLGCELPTEAQWEYGCRAETSSVYWSGDGLEDLGEVANIADAYGKGHGGDSWSVWHKDVEDGNTVHADVGSYRANAFGLHDVHGNVWEWCRDGYADYPADKQVDPLTPWSGASTRVLRGGSFYRAASEARSARRDNDSPSSQSNYLGLRPARDIDP